MADAEKETSYFSDSTVTEEQCPKGQCQLTLPCMRAAAKVFFVVFCASLAFAQKGADGIKSSPLQVSDLRFKADSITDDEAGLPSTPSVEAAKPIMVVATTSAAKTGPQIRQEEPVSERQKKVWYSLLAADHSAAIFDAWSTRHVLSNGGRELDPLVRPFAHSASLYPALQVAPVGADYLGLKLMRSQNRLLRRMWWVPQAAAAAGSVFCGVTNLAGVRSFQ